MRVHTSLVFHDSRLQRGVCLQSFNSKSSRARFSSRSCPDALSSGELDTSSLRIGLCRSRKHPESGIGSLSCSTSHDLVSNREHGPGSLYQRRSHMRNDSACGAARVLYKRHNNKVSYREWTRWVQLYRPSRRWIGTLHEIEVRCPRGERL